MAVIYLESGEISTKILNDAKQQLEKAEKQLFNIDSTVSNAFYTTPYGYSSAIFTADQRDTIGTISSKLSKCLSRLEIYAEVLAKGPTELEKIDAECKNAISTVRERRRYNVSNNGTWGALTSLFGGGAAVAGLTELEKKQNYAEYLYESNSEYRKGRTKEKLKRIVENSDSKEEIKKALERPAVIEVNDYSAGVTRGSIRYCNQNPAYYNENGWSEGDKYECGGMCNRAVESMALSYLGIDQSPSSMHDNNTIKKYEFAASGVDNGYCNTLDAVDGPVDVQISGINYFNRETLDELVKNYENDGGAGIHSPVIVHYANGEQHWILITGKNADGSYSAIGPWSNNGQDHERTGFNVYIDDNGVVSGSGFSWCEKGTTVVNIGQYTRVEK